MMQRILGLGTGFAVVAACASAPAGAVTIYDTDFTSADGFTEGAAIQGVDGWIAQSDSGSAVTSTNVATNGQMVFDINFLRGFNAPTAFNVGDVITITAEVASLAGNAPGFDANLLQVGLTEATAEGDLGSASVRAGVNLGGGSNDLYDLAFTSPTGTKTDTTVNIDTAFHTLVTSITKTATANEFLVTASLDGFSLTPTTITNAALYGATTVNTIVFAQGQSNTGGIAVDSINVALVPEPASLALLSLGSLCLLGRRQR